MGTPAVKTMTKIKRLDLFLGIPLMGFLVLNIFRLKCSMSEQRFFFNLLFYYYLQLYLDKFLQG